MPEHLSSGRGWSLAAALVALGASALMLANGGFHPRDWLIAAALLIVATVATFLLGRHRSIWTIAGMGTAAAAALALWSGISMQWAWYSRHLAWDEANRVLMYAAAFALGAAWLARPDRLAAAAAWVAGTWSVVAVVGLVRLWRFEDEPLGAIARAGADVPDRLVAGAGGMIGTSGRLDWPTGYANTTATMALLGILLALGVASAATRRLLTADEDTPGSDTRDLVALAAALAGAGALAACFVLTQSRGGILAAAAGVTVLLLASPARGILLTLLAALAGAVAVAWTALTEPLVAVATLRAAPFDDSIDAAAVAVAAEDAVRAAAASGLRTAVLAGVAGLAVGVIARFLRGRGLDAPAQTVGRIAVIGVLVVGVGAGLALGDRVASWGSAQVEGCRAGSEAAEPSDPTERSRLAEVGSNRCDFWRVAVDTARERPLAGIGANNFQGPYVLLRQSSEQPRQGHSLPLDVAATLGIVGVALLLTWFAAPVTGAVRYIRAGSGRDPAIAGGVAAIAAWAVHASVDWVWNMPAVTLPVVVIAGGLAARGAPRQAPAGRAAMAAAMSIGLLVVVGSYLPQQRADANFRTARAQLLVDRSAAAAHRSAAAAASWDPTWAQPVVFAARLSAATGRTERARTEARTALEREPNNWSVQLQAACALEAAGAPAAEVAAAVRLAHSLNPRYEPAEGSSGVAGC